jgi:hypothetical protein
MRFIVTPDAVIPWIVKKGVETAKESTTDIFLNFIHDSGIWLALQGLPIIAEMTLIWGMACFLIGCTGSSRWIERGVKSVLFSVMVGVARYAI